MTNKALLLFQLSCTTAVIHALIPDHWLPFALMARAQRWSDRRTAVLVGLTGMLHVLVSIAVGAAGVALGREGARGLAERAGRPLESLAGLLLVIFGLGYGLWAHRREGLAHRAPGTRDPKAPMAHGHIHAHGHLLERLFRRVVSGGALVVIVGVSPCALLVPILFAASAHSALTFLVAGLGFAVCTVGTMVGVTLFATRGMRHFDLPFFTRYGDLISGVLIAAVGLLVMLEES
ncbi:MAG: hypothetical protein ACE5JH_09660 [Acidobacteriota bacterium]